MSSFIINHLIVETFFTQYRKVRDQIDTFKILGTKLANDVKVRDQIRRLCLFWVKITSGNAFPEMRLFGCSGKFYFPEIEIRWPKKNAFDHENHFTLLFSLQNISRKWERERERARARERRSDQWRDLAKRRSRSRIFLSRRWSRFFSGLWLVFFSGFVFSFFFSKHQKIFSGKFFEMQPNTWKYFPFPEISISGKYIFSEKRFTATKHSLNWYLNAH